MIEEEMEQWVSEFHPTVETYVLEILRSRVQYAILDELNHMVSKQFGTPDQMKKLVLEEVTQITEESIELEQD